MAEELELSQKKKVEEAVRLLRLVTVGNEAAGPSLAWTGVGFPQYLLT